MPDIEWNLCLLDLLNFLTVYIGSSEEKSAEKSCQFLGISSHFRKSRVPQDFKEKKYMIFIWVR